MAPPKISKQITSQEQSLGLPENYLSKNSSTPQNPQNDSRISWLDAQRHFEKLAALKDELGDGFLRSIVFWGEGDAREEVEKALQVSSVRDRTDLAVVHLEKLSELISKTGLLSSPSVEGNHKPEEGNLLRAKQMVLLLRLNGFRVMTEDEVKKENTPPVPFTKKEDIENWKVGIDAAEKNYKALGVSILSLEKIENVLSDPSAPHPLEGKQNLRKFLTQIGIDLSKIIDASSPVIFPAESDQLLASLVGLLSTRTFCTGGANTG